MKKISIKPVIFPLIVILFLLVFLGVKNNIDPKLAEAGNEHNTSGYAWSSNIGWISFNSNDCTPQQAPVGPRVKLDTQKVYAQAGCTNYGVNVNAINGDFSGYAWSDNIGWVSFQETSGCPSGSCRPNLDIATGDVTGWARAISPTQWASSSDHGGWDGWVKLSDSNYGVVKSGNSLSGFAWGSDVVGWIDFSGVTVDLDDVCPNILGVQASVPVGMVVDGNGCCSDPWPTDKCENFCGTQLTVPVGFTQSGRNCVPIVIIGDEPIPTDPTDPTDPIFEEF